MGLFLMGTLGGELPRLIVWLYDSELVTLDALPSASPEVPV